mmetsp:Transcript_4412/g.8925  ORF Transcript_4412/g.8925 Transcript_4412/m.8925 type:complete len:90 (-) Transcript_4412:76-345(-)
MTMMCRGQRKRSHLLGAVKSWWRGTFFEVLLCVIALNVGEANFFIQHCACFVWLWARAQWVPDPHGLFSSLRGTRLFHYSWKKTALNAR